MRKLFQVKQLHWIRRLSSICFLMVLVLACRSLSLPNPTPNPTRTVVPTTRPTLELPQGTAFPGWEHYPWGWMAEVIERVRFDVEAETTGYAIFPTIKFRENLIYLAKFRPILDSRKDLLTFWVLFMTPDGDENYPDLYLQEVLFLDEHTMEEVWIPVQEEVIADMELHLRQGYRITTYLMFIGADQSISPTDWVFWLTTYDDNVPQG